MYIKTCTNRDPNSIIQTAQTENSMMDRYIMVHLYIEILQTKVMKRDKIVILNNLDEFTIIIFSKRRQTQNST